VHVLQERREHLGADDDDTDRERAQTDRLGHATSGVTDLGPDTLAARLFGLAHLLGLLTHALHGVETRLLAGDVGSGGLQASRPLLVDLNRGVPLHQRSGRAHRIDGEVDHQAHHHRDEHDRGAADDPNERVAERAARVHLLVLVVVQGQVSEVRLHDPVRVARQLLDREVAISEHRQAPLAVDRLLQDRLHELDDRLEVDGLLLRLLGPQIVEERLADRGEDLRHLVIRPVHREQAVREHRDVGAKTIDEGLVRGGCELRVDVGHGRSFSGSSWASGRAPAYHRSPCQRPLS